MNLTSLSTSYLKKIGHTLKPILIIGKASLTPNLISELNRALNDHELVKIKILFKEQVERKATIKELCELTKAELIQRIGHTALLFRPAIKQNQKLSNIIRYISR